MALQEKMKASGKYRFVSKPAQAAPVGLATDQTDEREPE
jgi:hypothetical protein